MYCNSFGPSTFLPPFLSPLLFPTPLLRRPGSSRTCIKINDAGACTLLARSELSRLPANPSEGIKKEAAEVLVEGVAQTAKNRQTNRF